MMGDPNGGGGRLPRETLLGMLNSLPDDALVKALGAAGVSVQGGGEGYQDSMGPEAAHDDAIVPWNATDVKVPSSQRPSLFDRAALIEKEVPKQMGFAATMGAEPPDQDLGRMAAVMG